MIILLLLKGLIPIHLNEIITSRENPTIRSNQKTDLHWGDYEKLYILYSSIQIFSISTLIALAAVVRSLKGIISIKLTMMNLVVPNVY